MYSIPPTQLPRITPVRPGASTVSSGVGDRLGRGRHAEVHVAPGAPDLLGAHRHRRVEVLDLAGDVDRIGLGVEPGDAGDAAFAGHEIRPARRHIVADRRDRSQPGDYCASHMQLTANPVPGLRSVKPAPGRRPRTMYFVVVSSFRATGPRACSREVEIPISAPIPYSPPSVKRVDALTYTAAASTSVTNRSAAVGVSGHDRLRMAGAVGGDVVERLVQ